MQLGQNPLALSYLDQAMPYSQESPTLLPSVLCNRACAFGKLGEFDSALNAAKEGVVKARSNKDRMGECACLAYCGIVLIDQNRLDEAKEHLVKAIEIADDVANLQFQNEARLALALAHLYAGNLAEARTFGEAALRIGYFQSAIAKADEILASTPTHCAVLEPKALALCGLALCLDPAYANTAAETYREKLDYGSRHRLPIPPPLRRHCRSRSQRQSYSLTFRGRACRHSRRPGVKHQNRYFSPISITRITFTSVRLVAPY
jgi:tetratricopeptide (TPR) repeat protein